MPCECWKSPDRAWEYSDKYWKAWGHLWLCNRDESALNAAGVIIDFPGADNNSALFKFKQKTTGQTENGTKNFEVMVPWKYPSYFGELLTCL